MRHKTLIVRDVCVPCVRYDKQCLRVDYSKSSLLCDLALDVERGLLYYTEYSHGVIVEMTTNGSNRRQIFRDSTQRSAAIVVLSLIHI